MKIFLKIICFPILFLFWIIAPLIILIVFPIFWIVDKVGYYE